ncbi:TPA: hypothetical protein ACH27Q_004814 [Raoultella ornithinolytica]
MEKLSLNPKVLESPADIYISNCIYFTGFEKTLCKYNDGIFSSLCIQIRPYYVPSKEWIQKFSEQLPYKGIEFFIIKKVMCYMSVSNIYISLDEVDSFTNEINKATSFANCFFDNDNSIKIIPAKDCGLAIYPNPFKILDKANFLEIP